MCDEWLRIGSIAYTTGLSMGRTWGPVSSVGTDRISLRCRLGKSRRMQLGLQLGLQHLFYVKKLITIPEGNPKELKPRPQGRMHFWLNVPISLPNPPTTFRTN